MANCRHSDQYKEFLMLVGQITIEFTKAEFPISQIINIISNSKEGSNIYNQQYSVEKKIKEFKKQVKRLDNQNAKKVIDLLKQLDKCRKDRNKIVHSQWVYLTGKEEFYLINSRIKKYQHPIQKLTIKEIKIKVENMTRVYGDIAVEFGRLVIKEFKINPELAKSRIP